MKLLPDDRIISIHLATDTTYLREIVLKLHTDIFSKEDYQAFIAITERGFYPRNSLIELLEELFEEGKITTNTMYKVIDMFDLSRKKFDIAERVRDVRSQENIF